MREKWPYYRRKIYLLLLAVSFILGVHGLYVYYRPIISQDWQLVSAMLYGTMKLYLFAPPLIATADVSLSYEIAKWLAPILTSALVLTALTNRVLHLRNLFRNLFGDHLLVFGDNGESRSFFSTLYKEKNPLKKSLVATESMSDEKKQDLERSGVAVYIQDPRSLSLKERQSFARQIRLSKSGHVLFIEKEQRLNYQLFMTMLPLMRLKERTKVHLRISSPALMDYVMKTVEARKKKEESLGYLDLHFFDQNSLSLDLLLSGGGAVHFLAKQLEGLEQKEDFLEEIPQVHLLLYTFNALSEKLMLRSINDFVVKRGKIKISLLDEAAEQRVGDFLYSNPMLEQAIEIHPISTVPGRRGFREAMAELSGNITAAFLNHHDPLKNLEVLNGLEKDLPIAFYNQEKLDLGELKILYPKLRFYGALDQVMNARVVLGESLDQAAMAFNRRYDEVASVLGSGGSNWEALSPTKKASSRLSAAHRDVKEALVLAITGEDKETLKEKTKEREKEFIQLTQQREGEAFKEGLEEYFGKYPHLRALSELEHIRWCYSYYALGFRQGQVKNEEKKTHPCLNCSWEFLMEEAFFECHPEYDLISVLSLFGE